jgi:hypothetical protein
MNENEICVSYRWAFVLDVIIENETLKKEISLNTIGQDYTEAKETLAIHLRNRKMTLQGIKSANPFAINVAYYEADLKHLSKVEMKKLKLPPKPDPL